MILKRISDYANKRSVQSPCVGKCSWTYKEALDSILNDTVLENTNENIIDSVLNYYEYLNKKGDKK